MNYSRPPKKRVTNIISRLRREYPQARVSLKYKNPFELLVSTILSAQCTDLRANEVSRYLFKKYKNPKGFASARISVLEKEIYSTGFYRAKAKNIINASKRLLTHYKGSVPKSMKELITLAGVGRKTANIILSSAFKKREGIAVDTHVKRLSKRLGLTSHTDPNKIEQDLLKIIPHKDWLDVNYILVTHGRRICNARKPLCCDCKINKLCPSNRCKR